MQGKSSHNRQGDRSANKTGVASWLCATIAPGGQALRQSPHLVQRSRKIPSPAAPGGRSQSVRIGIGPFAGAASASLENSCAAFATERTESLIKSRRPYEGSVAIEKLQPSRPDGQNGRRSHPPSPGAPRRAVPRARPQLTDSSLAARLFASRFTRYVSRISKRCENKAGGPFHHLAYMTPSARSLYTSTQRSQAPNSTSHPGWFSRIKSRTYDSILLPMSSTQE